MDSHGIAAQTWCKTKNSICPLIWANYIPLCSSWSREWENIYFLQKISFSKRKIVCVVGGSERWTERKIFILCTLVLISHTIRLVESSRVGKYTLFPCFDALSLHTSCSKRENVCAVGGTNRWCHLKIFKLYMNVHTLHTVRLVVRSRVGKYILFPCYDELLQKILWSKGIFFILNEDGSFAVLPYSENLNIEINEKISLFWIVQGHFPLYWEIFLKFNAKWNSKIICIGRFY